MSQPKTYFEKRARFARLLQKLLIHLHGLRVDVDLGPGVFLDLRKTGKELSEQELFHIGKYWESIGGTINKNYWTVE